ncbi:hypothetical protein I7I53_02091 [Histoplasma capsulatum var. duboisii H88]|uniref:Uncharacterized protein n=1 Tax=Ajellomyces capsulatus (strain H88) TaxID=544711 RepID=A0A8A1LM42_AJEC8|nr:hypothetical protein I7I53_02091 [Histoplasma capsulatum var. duboisii H88]
MRMRMRMRCDNDAMVRFNTRNLTERLIFIYLFPAPLSRVNKSTPYLPAVIYVVRFCWSGELWRVFNTHPSTIGGREFLALNAPPKEE